MPSRLDDLTLEPPPDRNNSFYNSQFSSGCARLLLVEDDLSRAGVGWTARHLHAVLLAARRDGRVLMEVPAADQPPRWCDKPPYTLQCLYAPWSPCALPPAQDIRSAPSPASISQSSSSWPHEAAIVRVRLSRVSARHLPPPEDPTRVDAYDLLLRARSWVRTLAKACAMEPAALRPRRFVVVHIRESAEKRAEFERHGVRPPPASAVHRLSLALSRRLGLTDVFLQTSNPSALSGALAFANATGELRASYTDNRRSEHDAWGGWDAGQVMGQAVVAAVNLHVGACAAAVIGAEGSLWTGLLAARLGRHAIVRYADCGGSLITVGMLRGPRAVVHTASLFTARSAPHLPAGCEWTSRAAWGQRQTAPLLQAGSWMTAAVKRLASTAGGAFGRRRLAVHAPQPRPIVHSPVHAPRAGLAGGEAAHASGAAGEASDGWASFGERMRQSTPDAVVLAGPHKTASTHLQLFLSRNRAALLAHGWRWPDAPIVRHATSPKGLAVLAPALLNRSCASDGVPSSIDWWTHPTAAPRCHGDPIEAAAYARASPAAILASLAAGLAVPPPSSLGTSRLPPRPLLATEELDVIASDAISERARREALAHLRRLLLAPRASPPKPAGTVVAVVVLRRPHVAHLRSGWAEWLADRRATRPLLASLAELAERWARGGSAESAFGQWACAQLDGRRRRGGIAGARLPWFDPLGLAVRFADAGFDSVVIDAVGARDAGRDISDALSCDVLHMPCDTSGLATWAEGRTSREYARGGDGGGDDGGGATGALSPTAERALTAYFDARDCATIAALRASPRPVHLLHADALIHACGGAARPAEAAEVKARADHAEAMRAGFVLAHCPASAWGQRAVPSPRSVQPVSARRGPATAATRSARQRRLADGARLGESRDAKGMPLGDSRDADEVQPLAYPMGSSAELRATWHDFSSHAAACSWQASRTQASYRWGTEPPRVYGGAGTSTVARVSGGVCSFDGGTVGQGRWYAHRIGPLNASGGFDWHFLLQHDVMGLGSVVAARGEVWVTAALTAPTDASYRLLGFPSVHLHHSHLYASNPGMRRSGDVGGHNLIRNHHDNACAPERGGSYCNVAMFPAGYGLQLTRRSGSFTVDALLNDARDPGSPVQSFYLDTAVRLASVAKRAVHLLGFALHPHLPADGRAFGTFRISPQRPTVVWATIVAPMTGRLLSLFFHVHEAQGFDEAQLYTGAAHDLGLPQIAPIDLQARSALTSSFQCTGGAVVGTTGYVDGVGTRENVSAFREALAHRAAERGLGWRCTARRVAQYGRVAGDMQPVLTCAPGAEALKAGERLTWLTFFDPSAWGITRREEQLLQHLQVHGYIAPTAEHISPFTQSLVQQCPASDENAVSALMARTPWARTWSSVHAAWVFTASERWTALPVALVGLLGLALSGRCHGRGRCSLNGRQCAAFATPVAHWVRTLESTTMTRWLGPRWHTVPAIELPSQTRMGTCAGDE